MRALFPLTLLICGACSLKRVLPGTAVLDRAAQSIFENPPPADVQYTAPPRFPSVFPPLQVFGLQYAVDVVLVTQHPDWEMHEYARLDTPKGSFWIAKDANRQGVQTIVSDAPDLNRWLPEIPIPRIQAPVKIDDRSSGAEIDLRLAYTNPAGEPVEVWTRGHMPDHPPAKRNGNTMGHSRDIVAAVLDLERFGSRVRAGVRIGNKPVRLDRLLGLMPFKFLLRQTQAGVAITSFRVTPAEDGFTLTRPASTKEAWPTQATETWKGSSQVASHDNGVCRLSYRFQDGGLTHAQIHQAGVEAPIFELWLTPALPDLRRPFKGTVKSTFRMDVGDQAGHGTGELRASWVGPDTVELALTPTAPSWLADRPMKTRIVYASDGSATVHTIRTDQAP